MMISIVGAYLFLYAFNRIAWRRLVSIAISEKIEEQEKAAAHYYRASKLQTKEQEQHYNSSLDAIELMLMARFWLILLGL